MLEALRLILAFLVQHASQFADIVKTGAKQRLSDAITALDEYAATNIGGTILAKDLTRKQEAQRAALVRDHMVAIAQIAKADLQHAPELSALRMPREKLTGERLAAAAVRMAKAAELHAPVFIAAGMPEDFVAELTAAAEELVHTVNERTTSRSLARGAGEGLKVRMAEARKVVAILDAFVKKALKDDPALLEQWKMLKKVPRGPRTATTTSPTESGTPAPAAPTPPSAPTAASTASASPTSSPVAA